MVNPALTVNKSICCFDMNVNLCSRIKTDLVPQKVKKCQIVVLRHKLYTSNMHKQTENKHQNSSEPSI